MLIPIIIFVLISIAFIVLSSLNIYGEENRILVMYIYIGVGLVICLIILITGQRQYKKIAKLI